MKLVVLATLAVQSAAPAPQQTARTLLPTVASNIPNGLSNGPGCFTVVQQIQDQARRHRYDEHCNLNREPPAHLQLAVDRHVAGCREVTLIRLNVAPAATSAISSR